MCPVIVSGIVTKDAPRQSHKSLRKLTRSSFLIVAKKSCQWRVPSVKLESFRFWDEDDYKNEIFPILRRARAQTNVIFAGKCGSRRQSSTTSFSKNVLGATTSHQVFIILPFSDRKRILPPSTEISVLTFVVIRSRMKLSGENRRENLKLNVVLVLESKLPS